MSKALSLSAAGVGASSVVVGGYYMATGMSKGVSSEEQTEKKELWTLKDFKDAKERDCVKDLFSGKEIDLNTFPENTNTISASDNYFGTAPTSDQQTNKSCLLINGKKITGTESKGSGVFTGTWTFINDGKGFINFNVATAEEAGKLKLTGGFYLLEKKADQSSNDWEIKYHKEVNDGKEISESDFETKFPKKKFAAPKDQTDNSNYWNFMKDKNDLTNISNITSNASPTPTSEKWMWKWESGGQNEVGKGGENLKNWGELLYKEESNNFDLEKKLETFKTGTGTLKE